VGYNRQEMNRLRRDDHERARATPPAEKLRQALEMMDQGIRLKRASLRARHPTASEEEIDSRLREWLESDD